MIQQEQRTRGLLVVLSGPSGVGKGRLRAPLLQQLPDLHFCVSATSRPPRQGEVDGVHYLFLSEQEFMDRVRRGEFLEWADVYGQLKGTPAAEVDRVLSSGKHALLEKDVQGALAIKRARPEAILVFIAPPSLEELFRRLSGRGTETPEQLARRRAAALAEMELSQHYDYLVVNDRIEDAIEQLRAIIIAESRRISRQPADWIERMAREGSE